MHFLVIAKDRTGPEVLQTRASVREKHLGELGPLVATGVITLGGAILDEDGNPRGSAILIEADTEADVRSILERDVYRVEGVWESFEIYPFRRAI